MSQDLLDKMPSEVRAAILSVIHSPGWACIEQYEKELELSVMREMSTLTDPVLIYRAQGKIEGMRLLLGLKETLSSRQSLRRMGG